ncbi:MAG: GIY-YIG nuclease family protein, partial [Acidaminococcaceae bacterium]|nr:GIY-YIG nuclease family protein [Acidaminococcaceae bacterium]
MNESLAATLAVLPNKPGVYIMRDVHGKIIYVGKAIILKNRVRSYFRPTAQLLPKVRVLVSKVDSLETIVTANEMEALVLECNLIKQYRPRYNISLKDDKSYPYLKVTIQEEFPRVYVTRHLAKDGARYFGPYPDAGALHTVVQIIRAAFP